MNNLKIAKINQLNFRAFIIVKITIFTSKLFHVKNSSTKKKSEISTLCLRIMSVGKKSPFLLTSLKFVEEESDET